MPRRWTGFDRGEDRTIPPDARTDRRLPHPESATRKPIDRPAQGAGRQDRARRFRFRLLQHRLSAPVRLRPAEDRPVDGRRGRYERRSARHIAGDDGACALTEFACHRRGRGMRGTGGDPQALRLRRVARLSLWQAGARRGTRRHTPQRGPLRRGCAAQAEVRIAISWEAAAVAQSSREWQIVGCVRQCGFSVSGRPF